MKENCKGWEIPSKFPDMGYRRHVHGWDDIGGTPPAHRMFRDHFKGHISQYGVGGKLAESLLGNCYKLETAVERSRGVQLEEGEGGRGREGEGQGGGSGCLRAD